jgi:hypothetical protein
MRMAPLGEDRRTEVTFEFPASAPIVTQAYLMCRYETVPLRRHEEHRERRPKAVGQRADHRRRV